MNDWPLPNPPPPFQNLYVGIPILLTLLKESNSKLNPLKSICRRTCSFKTLNIPTSLKVLYYSYIGIVFDIAGNMVELNMIKHS